MYVPLIKALNYALERLSEFDVPGLPEFDEKRQIVFARSDAKCIAAENYLQGPYKPDIILVKWNVFKTAHEYAMATYPESYQSSICCKSSASEPILSWRNLLSTIEVKRGDSGGAGNSGNKRSKGNAKEKSAYIGDFWSLREDLKAPGSSKLPQPAPQKIVDEEYSTRSRMSAMLRCLSLHSHQLQFRHALARELREPHPLLQIFLPSHYKRDAEIFRKPRERFRRRSETIVAQNLVGRADRRSRKIRRQKSRRDHKSKHRRFKAQSTRATRYHLPSTLPTQ